jgi:hypothetical protein
MSLRNNILEKLFLFFSNKKFSKKSLQETLIKANKSFCNRCKRENLFRKNLECDKHFIILNKRKPSHLGHG